MPAYIWICNIQLQQHKHMQTKNAALQSNKFCLFVVLRKCLEFQSQIQHLSSMLNSFSRSTKNNKKVSQISEKSLKSNSGAYTHTQTWIRSHSQNFYFIFTRALNSDPRLSQYKLLQFTAKKSANTTNKQTTIFQM